VGVAKILFDRNFSRIRGGGERPFCRPFGGVAKKAFLAKRRSRRGRRLNATAAPAAADGGDFARRSRVISRAARGRFSAEKSLFRKSSEGPAKRPFGGGANP
jgi:hypothetical protein